jgi:signal transduction histidine kinase
MLLQRPKSLKNLILVHEVAFLFLVAVTGMLGGLSAYFWHQNSAESVRINALIYRTEQIRGELFGQIQEVIRARVLEDPRAFDVYSDYSRRLDKHFNKLRNEATSRQEDDAIQELQRSYREIQKDMNKIFSDPYLTSQLVRIKILDPRFAQRMIKRFEGRYIEFKQILVDEHKKLDQTLAYWTRFAPIMIPTPLILAVLLVLYTRRIMRNDFIQPMGEVMAGAHAISQGDLGHKIPVYGVVELSNLAVAINSMGSDLVRSRDALVESEKQAVLGSLIPVVAHNIRNPLASIRATAQLIEDTKDPDELKEFKQAIVNTTDRLGRWVSALVSYLHPLKPNFRKIMASKLLDATIVLLSAKLDEKNITVDKQGWDHDELLDVDPDLMEQALYGLFVNAVDASPVASVLTVCLTRQQNNFEIRISDCGPGIPFEPKAGNLEPGQSTKRFGTGLGIPIAFKICQTHGWNLKFNIHKGSGTDVIISAPLGVVEEVSSNAG